MPFSERFAIVESVKYVDQVIEFDDDENGSCISALNKIKFLYPNDEIFFANGGDRDKSNIPEMSVNKIKFLFGVGGDNKKNSSSSILKEWKYYHEDRIWGIFYNLFESSNVKVKELIVDPCKGMSFQKHFKRSEIFFISKGACIVKYSNDNPDNRKDVQLKKFDHYFVPVGQWHQITNPFDEPCHLIEIQYGETCIEEDIKRADYYNSN